MKNILSLFIQLKKKVTMSSNNNHLVIMAGGIGSRFWQMSTTDYP